ncbi:NAD(P)/FAD-dependent oxidoreductase [Acetobacteraceae bacterium KSS8]|uniref:NAD(P)/FAD-dependent oxidoreductase n=1 Tax=Endosaccharibacter trunci TaxID=2812733 RepID=A0ABT1W3Y3_9PROT|nr:NAD(P)/FAD-dependent oxidoreductase [Acetobacteraceae bacterium KSS8]
MRELDARVRRDLSLIDYPSRAWVPPRTHAGEAVLDVAIVGGGQGGLATAFGLRREKIDNIAVFDRNPDGLAGPWVTFARMLTLRTPKHVTGPDLGIPSLSPRAWFEARHGSDAWEALDKISRQDWQEYLNWFRRVLTLPVRSGITVSAIEPVPTADGHLLRLTLDSATGTETRLARKVVLATGIDGSGAWHVPRFIRDAVPADRWAHTSGEIEFGRLHGARIGVLGAGASAFDNAATALEAGAATVTLCLRRPELPRVNPYRWMENAGFLGHFASLPDLDRWRFMKRIFDLNQPPPQDTFWRCRRHAGFSLRTGCPWLGARMERDEIVVDTPDGALRFDFLIVGTGFQVDLSLRPELANFATNIALWRDRFTPPAAEQNALLGSHPYLGAGFEFLERDPGQTPALRHIHNFTFGATPSMGLSGASISGMRYGVARLVGGLSRALFLDDARAHLQSLLDYDTPELVSLDPPS